MLVLSVDKEIPFMLISLLFRIFPASGIVNWFIKIPLYIFTNFGNCKNKSKKKTKKKLAGFSPKRDSR